MYLRLLVHLDRPCLTPLHSQQSSGHVRRLFFVDDTLSAIQGGAPKAVVYPSSVSLEITIRADRRDHIMPPLLTITWVGFGVREGAFTRVVCCGVCGWVGGLVGGWVGGWF